MLTEALRVSVSQAFYWKCLDPQDELRSATKIEARSV